MNERACSSWSMIIMDIWMMKFGFLFLFLFFMFTHVLGIGWLRWPACHREWNSSALVSHRSRVFRQEMCQQRLFWCIHKSYPLSWLDRRKFGTPVKEPMMRFNHITLSSSKKRSFSQIFKDNSSQLTSTQLNYHQSPTHANWLRNHVTCLMRWNRVPFNSIYSFKYLS